MGHITPKRSGFTLMELLVVLGILGLLTAMLFPVFAQAREKGRQTVCLSNERHLGMASLMYTHDNDGFYLLAGDTWASRTYPYVKSVQVFHCPSDATSAQPPYSPVSYGMNANLVTHPPRPPFLAVMSASDISNKTVLLFEVAHSAAQIATHGEGWSATAVPLSTSVEGNGTFSFQLDGVVMSSGVTFSINNEARYATGAMSLNNLGYTTSPYYEGTGRHQDGANFLFADAHAQWLPPGRVSAGDNCWLTGTYSAATGCAANSDDSAFAATFSPR